MDKPPFKYCELFLKQINSSLLSHDEKLSLDITFPEYKKLDLDHAQNSVTNKLKKVIDDFDNMIDPEKKFTQNFKIEFINSQIRTRRFSGGDTLPRNRYYTVANNPLGEDNDTLKNELYAYYRPVKVELFYLWDTTRQKDKEDLRDLYNIQFNDSIVLGFPVFSGHDLKSIGFQKVQVNHESGTFINIPICITSECIDNIIDLREPDVAKWFAKYFGSDMLFTPLKHEISSFKEILPSLLYQQNGGGSFSEIVGKELRRIGANGFIFPSARADSFVNINNKKVTGFGGWNFVDYRDLPFPDGDIFIDSEPEWSDYIDNFIGGQLIKYRDVNFFFSDDINQLGSWKIEGLVIKNKAIKEIKILSNFIVKLNFVNLPNGISLILGLFDIWLVNGELAYNIALHLNNVMYLNDKNSYAYLKTKLGELKKMNNDNFYSSFEYFLEFKDILFMEWLWKKLR